MLPRPVYLHEAPVLKDSVGKRHCDMPPLQMT